MADITADAQWGQHRVTVSGDLENLSEFEGLGIQLTATGTDLSELNSILGLAVPPTDHYEMSALVAGNAESQSARDILIEGAAPGASLELRGTIGRILELHDMDLAVNTRMDSLAVLTATCWTAR